MAPFHPRPRGASGFTLLELLLALIIGTLLVTALTSTLQVFGRQVEELRKDDGRDLGEAMAEVGDAVRQAWLVATPAEDQLVLTDALGNQTVYEQVGDVLRVTRPNGVSGDLLTGVKDVSFSTGAIRRLRDDPPVGLPAVIKDDPAPGTPSMISLVAGQAIAVGFTVPVAAPSSVKVLDDVDELAVQAAVTSIQLPVGLLNGNNKQFCHLHAAPPHNPTHKGYQGGKLFVDIYEARAPGDPRPYGPAVASAAVAASNVPAAPYTWIDSEHGGIAYPPDAIDWGSLPICPDGEECPDYPHAHEGDSPNGVAWGWWELHPEVILSIEPPSTFASIDLGGQNLLFEPGKAYTMVLRVGGYDMLVLNTVPVASLVDGMAVKDEKTGPFERVLSTVQHRLEGTIQYTQTVEHEPTARITVALELADGSQLTASAPVLGQAAITNPWYGIVDGELQTFELAGQ